MSHKKSKNKYKHFDSGASGHVSPARVLEILKEFDNKSFNANQLATRLKINSHQEKEQLISLLARLRSEGQITENERGKYSAKALRPYITGKVDMTATGAAYIISPEVETDIYISPRNTGKALHGDTVKAYIFSKQRGRRIEGEIVEIVQRAKSSYVGIIRVSPKFAFLVPDNPKMSVDLYIPLDSLNGAKDGQKVIGRITDWSRGATNPFGEITEVLGDPGDNDVEMNSILAEYDFPLSFPDNVEKDAAALPIEITKEEIARRRDFRRITTFTIDPHDAKDFDDALSFRVLDNGNYEIGIHIADVSHYVKPGTALEEEAYKRATSVYLVDRVIPMLPEKLSNNVCSLRPHEEKLCYSAVFEIDAETNVSNEWFGRTVIYSDRRFTYDEAQQVIETNEGDFASELKIMNTLAKKMRSDRFAHGAIGFDKMEVKFNLDDKGKPIGVYVKQMKDSNHLIEEFMLLANRKVAEFIGKQRQGSPKRTFVYRIHDSPSDEKIGQFSQFIRKFGYKIKTGSPREIAKSMNVLFKEIKGKAEENIIEQLAIRSMQKAIYTTDNIGHYGLAFDYYSHFTSPIRRYPDVMAHRLLEHYADGGASVKEADWEAKCKHSSEMEKKATEAERASIKYKQVQYLMDKIGESFEGIISGVTDWGLFVEIVENKCEGMIRLKDIDDDFYTFDEDNFSVTGRNSGASYRLGDKVTIKVKRADLVKKQLDFLIVHEVKKKGF